MPVNYGKDKNGNYVKWGSKGKKYYYTKNNKRSLQSAKEKVRKQMMAIYINKNK